MRILLLTFLALLGLELTAQFRGIVMSQSGQVIQDVTVQVLKTAWHTHTNELGQFEIINATAGDSLRFTILGYHSRIVVMDDMTKRNEIYLNESPIQLDDIEISSPVQQNIQKLDLHIRPVQNSQELLRFVPGLFIAQHAGAGKAEQIFLRGFDIDHGTDIQLTVDDLIPVNMVSHAHGQAYADLHFVIPETVQSIEFDKGSYNARRGNFATAGYVNFKLKERVTKPQLVMEAGSYDFHRYSSLIPMLKLPNFDSYLACEYLSTQGYFDHPQGLKKYNVLAKLNKRFSNYSGLKTSLSYFSSHWSASGQIPIRAVKDGAITRFGAIDPTEGGMTSRLNIFTQYYFSKSTHDFFKISAFYSNYNFELFSNFTFYLYDSIHGDQIKQKEYRNIAAVESVYEKDFSRGKVSLGLGSRLDWIPYSELSRTKNKIELLSRLSLGTVREINSYLFAIYKFRIKHMDMDVQWRLDRFDVSVFDRVRSDLREHSEFRFSPKFNFQYVVNKKLSAYVKTGLGFHSNDSRVVVFQERSNLTTQSGNADLGLQYKWSQHTILHSGLWFIGLEDELVYVGDEGIVEASGRTRRMGWEAGCRSRFLYYFTLDIDLSYTWARSLESEKDANFIPLAMKWNSEGGLDFNYKHMNIGMRYRFMGDRPANENYSIVAPGYFLVDSYVRYQYKNIGFGVQLENILNAQWNEAQFATLSRLKDEKTPVEELHFTPGTPINFRLKLEIQF